MTTQYVQFTDSTQTTICSVYGCPQDPIAHPNQGEVDDTDARYVAFITPPVQPLTVTPLQLRLGLTAAGLRTAVESWVPTASQEIQDSYNHASVFIETDPLITEAASQFNLTTAQIHSLMLTMQTLSP